MKAKWTLSFGEPGTVTCASKAMDIHEERQESIIWRSEPKIEDLMFLRDLIEGGKDKSGG